jgi:hypothetical protein
VALYLLWNRQAKLVSVQLAEGTHKLADPVSKMTPNSCGGVPRVIVPKYWACKL